MRPPVTLQDLVAFSLLTATPRRAAALQAVLDPASRIDGPSSQLLERLIAISEAGETCPDRRAAELRRTADELIGRARATGLEPIAWTDDRYPTRLRTIADPPAVLWVRGDPTLLGRPAVAVVGSRAASPYGLSVARTLGHDLAAAGLTIVSGMARGCDAAAHQGALDADGRTAAILGCGVDIVYPAEHRNLYRRIVETGAIAGELPPGAPPLPHHFPRRNRLISGLVAGVVVIEASSRSGSLITAASALEQGRDVMAVPGNVLSQRHSGCHELLKDGARLVQSAQDVLEEIGWAPKGVDTEYPGDIGEPDSLLSFIAPGEEWDLETLAGRSGLTAAELLSGLTRLEMTGEVRRTAGGRFVRSTR
jgi:DNA processing protein